MEKEERKDIVGYEGKYQVSNLGRIKCLHPKGAKESKIMKWERNYSGYPRVKFYSGNGNLSRKTYQVHRLVYLTFNNLPIEYKKDIQVLHIDDNPENTRLDNLFLGTAKDNVHDCINKGRFSFLKPRLGEQNNMCTIADSIIIDAIREYKLGFLNQSEICKKYNIGRSGFNAILHGRNRKYLLDMI